MVEEAEVHTCSLFSLSLSHLTMWDAKWNLPGHVLAAPASALGLERCNIYLSLSGLVYFLVLYPGQHLCVCAYMQASILFFMSVVYLEL